MTLAFRNLAVDPTAPVAQWGVEGIAAAIDRGEVEDWARVIRALADDSQGGLAEQVREAIAVSESPGVRALMSRALERIADPEAWDVTASVRDAYRRTGLSQAQFAVLAETSRTRLNSYLTGAQLPSARVLRRIQRVGELNA